MLDRSGSMAGEKLEYCKRAAPSQHVVEKDLAKALIAAIASGGHRKRPGPPAFPGRKEKGFSVHPGKQ